MSENTRYHVMVYLKSGNIVEFTASEFTTTPNASGGLRKWSASDVLPVNDEYGNGFPHFIDPARIEAVVVRKADGGAA